MNFKRKYPEISKSQLKSVWKCFEIYIEFVKLLKYFLHLWECGFLYPILNSFKLFLQEIRHLIEKRRSYSQNRFGYYVNTDNTKNKTWRKNPKLVGYFGNRLSNSIFFFVRLSIWILMQFMWKMGNWWRSYKCL